MINSTLTQVLLLLLHSCRKLLAQSCQHYLLLVSCNANATLHYKWIFSSANFGMETTQSSECDSENLSKANSSHQNSSYIIKKELSMTTLKRGKHPRMW
jgi:hypothetical protein